MENMRIPKWSMTVRQAIAIFETSGRIFFDKVADTRDKQAQDYNEENETALLVAYACMKQMNPNDKPLMFGNGKEDV